MENIMSISYNNDNELLMIVYSGHDCIYIMQEIDMKGKIIRLYNNPVDVYKNVMSMKSAEYNRDSSKIICCGNDGIFYEWSKKGEILNTYVNQYADDKAIYNLSDSKILSCGYSLINEWNIGSDKPIMSLDFEDNCVTDIEYISDKKFIASFEDGTVKEFFTGTGEYIRNIISNTYNSQTEKEAYCGISFNCTTGETIDIDGIGIEKIFYNQLLNRILCICQTEYIKEFDYITGKLINEIKGIHFDACYNALGTQLFYTDVTNRCVYQMDTKTLKVVKSFPSDKNDFPKLISVNKNCKEIAIVYTDDTEGKDKIKVFDIETGKELLCLIK